MNPDRLGSPLNLDFNTTPNTKKYVNISNRGVRTVHSPPPNEPRYRLRISRRTIVRIRPRLRHIVSHGSGKTRTSERRNHSRAVALLVGIRTLRTVARPSATSASTSRKGQPRS